MAQDVASPEDLNAFFSSPQVASPADLNSFFAASKPPAPPAPIPPPTPKPFGPIDPNAAGSRGAPPPRRTTESTMRGAPPPTVPLPPTAPEPTEPEQSLIDPVLDMLPDLPKGYRDFTSPEGQALADTARGLTTQGNLRLMAGLAGANLIPGVGEVADAGAAVAFGHQMLEGADAANTQVQVNKSAAITARAAGNEEAAKQFDQKARYARAQSVINMAFLGLIASGIGKKAAELGAPTDVVPALKKASVATAGSVSELPGSPTGISPEPTVATPSDVADFFAAKPTETPAPETTPATPAALSPDEIAAEIQRLKAEVAQRFPETTPPVVPPTPESVATGQPDAQNAAPVPPEQVVVPEVPRGTPEAQPVVAENAVPANEPQDAASTTPQSRLKTMYADWRNLKTTGDALESDPAAMTKEGVQSYIDASAQAAATHYPEAAAPLEGARAALDAGDLQGAYDQAKRVRQGIRAEYGIQLAEDTVQKDGTPEDIAQTAKTSAEERAKNLENLGAQSPRSAALAAVDPAFQQHVDDAVTTHLNNIADFFEQSETGLTGKWVGKDEFGMNYNPDESGRRVGGGYKDAFPWLSEFTETPGKIAEAIRKGKGKLFSALQDATKQYVLDNETPAIQSYMDSNPNEDVNVGGRQQTMPELAREMAEQANKAREERLTEIAAGRRPEQLKEGQTFDQDRLVNSELFGGRGGPQGFLGTDERGGSESPAEDDSWDVSQFTDTPEKQGFLDKAIADSDAAIAAKWTSLAKGETLGANLPFELAGELAKNGAMRIARGVVDFAKWSKDMYDAFKDHFDTDEDPNLRRIYDESMKRVQAVKDAGVDLKSTQGQALLSGSLGTNGKYVKNEPFTFDFGKNDRKTGEGIRQEFAGKVNSQIERIVQLADSIRKVVPDKIDDQALKWYKDALVKSPDDPVGYLRAKAADPRFRDYKAQLEAAANLKPEQIAEIAKGNQYYAEQGRVSREIGTIQSMREEYQNHAYSKVVEGKTAGGGAGTGSQVQPFTAHAKERVYQTYFDAVEGIHEDGTKGTPQHVADLGFSDLIERHGREMARINTSLQMLDALKEQGIGGWSSARKAPEGFQQVGDLTRRMAFVGKDGKPVVMDHAYMAPQGIADALKAVTDPDKFVNSLDVNIGGKSRSVIGTLQKYQGIIKRADLSFSFFHDVTLLAQALYQGDFKAVANLYHFKDLMDTPTFKEMAIDHARNGGITARLHPNQDIVGSLVREMVRQSDGTYAEKQGLIEKLQNLPGIKQLGDLSQAHSNFLFRDLQTYLKVMDYGRQVSNWMEKHPDATAPEITAVKRGITAQGNAAFGGMNWQALGVTKSQLSLLRTVLLAPDWGASNVHLAREALKAPLAGVKEAVRTTKLLPAALKDQIAAPATPELAGRIAEGNAARMHYIRAAILSTIALEGLNQIFTGHSTAQNQKGHEWEVQVAPGVYFSPYRGGIGELLKLYSMSETQDKGAVQAGAQYSQGKLSPLARTAVGVLSGTKYSGTPITKAKTGTARDFDIAAYVARNLAPIPFGAGNLAEAASDKNMTTTGAVALGTGLGRYAPNKPKTRR